MDSSPLARLPAELRELIYQYALYQRAYIRIGISSGTPHLYNFEDPLDLSLTKTCRQLRAESLPALYAMNTFLLYTDHVQTAMNGYGLRNMWQQGLRVWLDCIGPAQTNLRNVEIEIGTWNPDDIKEPAMTVWNSISPMLSLFDPSRTRVQLNCSLALMDGDELEVSFSLTNAEAAQVAIDAAVARHGGYDPPDFACIGEPSLEYELGRLDFEVEFELYKRELDRIVELIREYRCCQGPVDDKALWKHLLPAAKAKC